MAETLEKRMGTVDILDCVLAVVSEKLREKDPETLGLSKNNIYDGFLGLKWNPKYADVEGLKYIDCRNEGACYSSKTLGGYLFSCGAYGGLRETREGNKTGYSMSRKYAQEKIEELKKEHGEEAVKKVEAMAEDFLAYIEPKKKESLIITQ